MILNGTKTEGKPFGREVFMRRLGLHNGSSTVLVYNSLLCILSLFLSSSHRSFCQVGCLCVVDSVIEDIRKADCVVQNRVAQV
jgi:hypothetical protein